MMRGRRFFVAAAMVIVLALLFGAAGSGQREAWTQGYLVGRLAAADGDAAVAPVAGLMPYAYGYPHHGPGGFLFVLFGLGVVALIASHFVRKAHWHAWAAQQGVAPGEGPQMPWEDAAGWGCGRYHHHPQEQQKPEPAAPPAAQAPGSAA